MFSLACLMPTKVIIVSHFTKLLPLLVGLSLVYGSYLALGYNSIAKNLFSRHSHRVEKAIPHYNALVSRSLVPFLRTGFHHTYKLVDGQ